MRDVIDLDWKNSAKSFQSQTQAKQRRIVKFILRQCAIGRNIKKWDKLNHSNSPLCKSTNKTTYHILQCQDMRAKNQWNESIKKLDKRMKNSKTSLEIQDAIQNGPNYLRNHGKSKRWNWKQGEYFDKGVVLAINHQKMIGWHNFVIGFVSPK